MKRIVAACLFFGVAAFAQMMPKDTAGQKVQLQTQKKPMVYVDGARDSGNVALNDATAKMDSRAYSNDSTIGTVIGVGAEFVGDVVKGMLSPNSAETDAVELERQRR